MAIKSSSLKRVKITVKQNTPTRSSTNEDVENWTVYLERHAEIMELRASEVFAFQQIYSEQVIKYRLRYDSKTKAVTPSMRAYIGTRELDILSVTNDAGKSKSVVMVCKERV